MKFYLRLFKVIFKCALSPHNYKWKLSKRVKRLKSALEKSCTEENGSLHIHENSNPSKMESSTKESGNTLEDQLEKKLRKRISKNTPEELML